MSLLNLTADGLFNILIVQFRALWQIDQIKKEKFIGLWELGAKDDQVMVTQTLRTWIDLGLFLENETIVRVNKDHFGGIEDLESATKRLPFAIRKLIFNKENNKKLWDRKAPRAEDLTRGLAWLLAQDIYATDLSSQPKVDALEGLQLKDQKSQIFQNDTRWTGIQDWATYLGFFASRSPAVVDPTQAIRGHLSVIRSGKKRQIISEFLERLSDELPVLDGGYYRKKVEENLDPRNWKRPKDREISTSLSRALIRLEKAGEIAIASPHDASGGYILIGQDGATIKRCTHIEMK